MDVILFWSLPGQNRHGHVCVSAGNIGAGHGALRDIIEKAENTKAARSMYAETQREKMAFLQSAKESEWNKENDPVVVSFVGREDVWHDFSQGCV